MAKPQILQRLKPGKFVWPGLFPFFAATWNWLVDSWDNLRGDFDVNPKLGAITVDRTNPDRPVIRLRTDSLKLGGSPELVPDDLSVDALGGAGANELELLEFQTKNPESETLARSLVQQSDADRQYVERGEDGNNKKVVKYRKQGYFYAGQNTNITFTPDGNGNVAIQVYYV